VVNHHTYEDNQRVDEFKKKILEDFIDY